jgi:hypothetical protein
VVQAALVEEPAVPVVVAAVVVPVGERSFAI